MTLEYQFLTSIEQQNDSIFDLFDSLGLQRKNHLRTIN